MSLLHFHRGDRAVTLELTPREFKRKARRALDDATWAVMQSEEASYRAREAVARCEQAEMKASTAYTCSIEAVQILAQEVREMVEGRPISQITFDEFLRQASSGAMRERKPAHGPRGAADALGVKLPE